MVLTSGYVLAVQKLQEAAGMSHQNVASRLSLAVTDAHKGTGTYASYVDHTGDGESGDCIYMANGDMKKAPYELSDVGDKATANLDTSNAVNVTPMTSYQEDADDDDQYASMEEAKLYTKGPKPLIERFISKSERSGASEDSFAGKGKSYPILKPGDVSAAVHAMGRAGSGNYGMAQLKANITRIAKAKGWTSELPKAWKGDSADNKESRNVPRGTSTVKLVESAVSFPGDFRFTEASSVNPVVKIINEGRGTSGYYTKEVLKRDGPKIFTPGTLMYINHATPAEEAARPEGDWNKLAAVTVGNAYWDDNGKDGPALYAPAKVFSDYATQVAEKAPYTGVSIRASGSRDDKKIAADGKPGEITGLDYAESIDLVTKAGRGGKLLTEARVWLTEAAKPANLQEVSDMDAAELTKLQESVKAANATNARLLERAIKGDAREAATKILDGLSLHEAGKTLVIENVLRDIPLKDGELDAPKFKESVEQEAKRIGAAFSAAGTGSRVVGMGAGEPITVTETGKPADIEAARVKTFMRLGLTEAAAKVAVRGRAA